MNVVEYVAEKIAALERTKHTDVNITPLKIEKATEPGHHVGADASRNKTAVESFVFFAIRSFSISNKGTMTFMHLDIVPIPRTQDIFLRFIMEALEHRTLSKHIDKENPKMVFIDGSLLTPAGIIPQYPLGHFAEEYQKNKEVYERYTELFKEVIEKTYNDLENDETLKAALFNLQFENLGDEYNDVKELHRKIVDTLKYTNPHREVFNFIQFLAYFEYLYETERLYEKTFKRDHVAIAKTSIASYISNNFTDKVLVRAALTKNQAYPGYVPFEVKFAEDTHAGLPAYVNPEKNFPLLVRLYRDPPLAAYYSFSPLSPVYIMETYSDIETIAEKVLAVSPPSTYYPKVLEIAHHRSKITADEMNTITEIVKNLSLSKSLSMNVRKPLS